jgi:hypothetical protein
MSSKIHCEHQMESILSTADVAKLLGTDVWRVRRLFEDRTLAEPGRLAGRRAIPSTDLPRIVDALRKRGWLPEAVEAAQ